FLDAWRGQRADALREISETSPPEPSPGRAGSAVPATDVLLEAIHRQLTAKSRLDDEQVSALDRLVQRFEVSKRLHGEYNERWRPIDSTDYRSLERYVRFAEILDLAYQHTGALTYLNALLKVADTLTALRATLDAPQRTRVRRVIAGERDHVERLAARLRGRV